MRSYSDITKLLGPPIWWDDNGVPRYEPFSPDMLGVYDRLGILLTIECQACDRKFKVAIALDGIAVHCSNLLRENGTLNRQAAAEISIYAFHYGDPPPHDCMGDTMNSTLKSIDEAWSKEAAVDWVRIPELEAVSGE